MRIAAAPADFEGCGSVRILLPYSKLRDLGHEVTFITTTNDPAVESTDVLVLQRQCRPEALDLVRRCRQRGTPVVYELDDHLHSLSPASPASRFYGAGKPATLMVERILKEVDALTVSTPELAREYGRFNANTYVCPNALDDRYVERVAPAVITGEPKRPGQVRIGWAGSFTHRADMLTVIPILTKLMREDERLRFVTIGDIFTHLFPIDVRPRVEALYGTRTSPSLDPNRVNDSMLGLLNYYHLAVKAEFDIAIAPLEQTLFNRCKSDLKLKEYGVFGYPAIGTLIAPYAAYQQQAREQVALLGFEPLEWEIALRTLINLPEKRAQLARANLAYVRERHLLSRGVLAWDAALRSIVSQKIPHQVPAPMSFHVERVPRLAPTRVTPLTAESRPGPLLINDAGLLGDALAALPLIHHIAEKCQQSDTKLRIMLAHDQVATLIAPEIARRIEILPWSSHLPVQERIAASRVYRLNVVEAMSQYAGFLHMMQSHFAATGCDPNNCVLPLLDPSLNAPGEVYDFVISPFSRSDVRGNKLWPLERWQAVIDRLTINYKVCVLGQREDCVTFSKADAIVDRSLREVANIIANARHGVLSIDNGISHLSHLMRVNHLLIYPACLPLCWARNTSPNAVHLVGWPSSIPVSAVMNGVALMGTRPPLKVA
jgi:hypothetical protein